MVSDIFGFRYFGEASPQSVAAQHSLWPPGRPESSAHGTPRMRNAPAIRMNESSKKSGPMTRLHRFLASTCRRENAAKANGGTATSCLGEAHTREQPWPRVFTLVRRSKIWRDIEMRQQGADIGSARRPSSAAQTTSSGSYIHKRTGCWNCPCKRKGLAPDAPSRIDHAEFRQRLPPDHLRKRGVSSRPSTAPRW